MFHEHPESRRRNTICSNHVCREEAQILDRNKGTKTKEVLQVGLMI